MDLLTRYGYENGDHHYFEFIEDGLASCGRNLLFLLLFILLIMLRVVVIVVKAVATINSGDSDSDKIQHSRVAMGKVVILLTVGRSFILCYNCLYLCICCY